MRTEQNIHYFTTRAAALLCVLVMTFLASSKVWAQTNGTCGDNLT